MRIELAKIESEVLEGDFELPVTSGGTEADPFLLKACTVHYRLYRINDTDIHLSAHYTGTMELSCTSCLSSYVTGVTDDFSVVLTSDRERHKAEFLGKAEDGSVEFLEGDIVDVGEQVLNTIVLNIPMAHQCREACQGICPVCGANRNESTCSCKTASVDPRWQALKTLMDKKE